MSAGHPDPAIATGDPVGGTAGPAEPKGGLEGRTALVTVRRKS